MSEIQIAKIQTEPPASEKKVSAEGKCGMGNMGTMSEGKPIKTVRFPRSRPLPS